MKRMQLISVASVLGSVLAISVSAQTGGTTPVRPAPTPVRPAPGPAPAPQAATLPDTRIAFINTDAFRDERTGIARFVSAIKSLEREFQGRQQELTSLQTRLKAIADEITRLTSAATVVDPKSIRAKQEEGERLQLEAKRKKEDADALFTRRYEEVVGPISQDIVRAIDQYANERRITMVLDITKLAPAILSINPAMDITQAFTADYNRRNPSTAPPR